MIQYTYMKVVACYYDTCIFFWFILKNRNWQNFRRFGIFYMYSRRQGDLVVHLSWTCEPIHRLDCLPLISWCLAIDLAWSACNYQQGTSLNRYIEIDKPWQLQKMTKYHAERTWNRHNFFTEMNIILYEYNIIFDPDPFSLTWSGERKHTYFNFWP